MKRFLNLNTVYMVAAIIVLGVLFLPRAVDIYNLRTQGINYFTNDIENYHNIAHPIEGEYTIEIDLNNLDKNKGKVLFDDEENQIYVSKVIAHNTNEYELFFRSSGSSSLGGATIISGVEHKPNNEGLISKFQAKAEATYRGNTCELIPSKYSGLNYSDADEFGFYLELPKELVPDFEEEGMIDVTVTNLYMNLWAEKSF
ncbi:hypothetical protein FZD47_18535 [Bacillus infantis]|uniref:Uncharacterized protein n=1 Tax=Bacillus infantis TaxID=324767 RepID=A0A5D4SG14_9BACI|nr:hypothetical protein [Bacillus infantis]TYS62079.1 hypothetical protein FZD47_18535 [Bacillus infantis]